LSGAATALRAPGHLDEVIDLLRRAVERDPLVPGGYYNLGWVLSYADRLAEADAAFRTAVELSPQRAFVRAGWALTLQALGRGDEAMAQALAEPDESFRLWVLAILHHAAGESEKSDSVLAELTA